MRISVALGRFPGLKAFLISLLCVVLVVSICPPFTFAVEPDDVGSASAAEEEQSQDLDAPADVVSPEPEGASDAGLEEADEGAEGEDGANQGDAMNPEASDSEASGDEAGAGQGDEGGIDEEAVEDPVDDAEGIEESKDGEGTEEGEALDSESSSASEEEVGADAKDEKKAEKPTVLEADTDEVHAKLTVDASVELPEGASLIVTSLVDQEAQAAEAAAAEAEAAAAAELEAVEPEAVAEEGEAAGEEAAAEPVDEPVDETVTGADVAIAGMTDAMDAYLQKRGIEEEGDLVVADAFAVEVVDGQDAVVSIDPKKAKLTFTLKAASADLDYENAYAIDRIPADEDATPEEQAALSKPVSTAFEEEYANGEQAAEGIQYQAKATKVTDELETDAETGEAELEVDGVKSILLVKREAAAVAAEGPVKAPPAGLPDTVNTINTADYGITLNLFDYIANDTVSNPSNTYGNNNTYGVNSIGGTERTNLRFYAAGNLVSDPGINTFAGENNGDYNQQYAMQGIVRSELGGSGTDYAHRYPELNTNGGGSLSYLFDGANDQYKTSYTNVNGLFWEDNGYLRYNSNTNYAWFDEGENKIYVYEDTYERHSDHGNHYAVGFFPFNQYTGNNDTYINPWDRQPTDVQHQFGMSMTAEITLPYGGQVNGEDMIFKFSGDDDMWVFLDGQLILDVGGIHQPVEGTINFATGEVSLGSGTVVPVSQTSYSMTQGDAVETNQPTMGTNTHLWNINPKTGEGQSGAGSLGTYDSNWRAGTTHTLQFFYLERGGCDSNLEIVTNIYRAPKKALTVTKQWANVTEDELAGQSVELELVRKAVHKAGELGSNPALEYRVVDTFAVTPDEPTKVWTGLPAEGYLSDTAIGTDPYYDFYYFVREKNGSVPEDYDTAYEGTQDGNIIVLLDEQLEYYNGVFQGVSAEYSPTTIVNAHTYVEVEKYWLNKAGEADDASHEFDEVWVQLYQQTWDEDSSSWLDEVPVDNGLVQLTDGNWSARIPVTQTGDGVRYIAKEGVMEGGSFVPRDVLLAAKDAPEDDGIPYVHVATNYTRNNAITDDGEIAWGPDEAYSGDAHLELLAYGNGKAVISNRPAAEVVLKKVDAIDGTSPLSATFEVYRDGEDPDTFDSAVDTQKVTNLADSSTSFTTGDDGLVTISGLLEGTYWVVETQAPDGFTLYDGGAAIQLVVAADYSVTGPSGDGRTTANLVDEDGVFTLVVPDSRAYDLPASGGPGMLAFLFVGAFAMALAAGLIIQRRKSYESNYAHASAYATRRW